MLAKNTVGYLLPHARSGLSYKCWGEVRDREETSLATAL